MRPPDDALADLTPWYIYGDAVLDRLAGTTRLGYVRAVALTDAPRPADVREVLGLSSNISVVITSLAPDLTFTHDNWVIDSRGDIVDVLSHQRAEGEAPSSPQWPVYADVVDPAFSYPDSIRLSRTLELFPDMPVEPTLAGKIRSDVRWLKEVSSRFPAVASTILEHETLLWPADRETRLEVIQDV